MKLIRVPRFFLSSDPSLKRNVLSSSFVFASIAIFLFLIVSCSKSESKSDNGGVSTPHKQIFGDQFEGQIDVAIQNLEGDKGEPPVTVSVFVKDDRARFEVPPSVMAQGGPMVEGMGSAWGTFSNKEKKIFLVSDPQKQALYIDLEQVPQQMASLDGLKNQLGGVQKDGADIELKVSRTSKKENIAGYLCEDWLVESAGHKLYVCAVDEGAPWLSGITAKMLPKNYAGLAALLDGHHFPLRVKAEDASGRETLHIEISKIEKKVVDANKFLIPAEYTKLDVFQLIQKMAAGIGPGGLGNLLGGAHLNGGGSSAPSFPALHGSVPSLPPGIKLPPGFKLPPGIKLPPGVYLPQSGEDKAQGGKP